MNFDEMNEAVTQAKSTLRLADVFVGRMAAMCVGRLRQSDAMGSTLTALKKELADWDMHRNTWINRK